MGSSSRERGTAAPLFGPCLLWPSSPISATAELLLLWPNDWIHQDTTCMEVDLSPQPTRLCVRRGRSPLPKKGRSPQFSARVYCSQTAAWFRMPLGMEVGLGLRDIVLDGAPASPPLKGHGLSQFSANVCCGQTAGWIKVAYGGRPRPRRLCVRCGPSSPREKGTCTHPYPIFGHVYSGQTTGWIKMPLGMEVNIGPGDVVLDGVAATPKRGTAPRFQFMSCGQTAGWMNTPLGMVWKHISAQATLY